MEVLLSISRSCLKHIINEYKAETCRMLFFAQNQKNPGDGYRRVLVARYASFQLTCRVTLFVDPLSVAVMVAEPTLTAVAVNEAAVAFAATVILDAERLTADGLLLLSVMINGLDQRLFG